MKDEYISVEHVFMGMLQRPGRVAGELFKQFGITPEKFMQVLSAVRGNQRVTTDNPESTYDSPEKIWPGSGGSRPCQQAGPRHCQ